MSVAALCCLVVNMCLFGVDVCFFVAADSHLCRKSLSICSGFMVLSG